MKSTFETVKENTFGKILTLLGTMIGIIGLLATIFFGLNDTIIKNEPRFEYDIISKTDFLNNSESTPYIKVFIEDSIDVQENHYNITAYSIKVENKGKKHISYRDYDEGFFGLKIENGTLLDIPILLSASNENIEKNFCTDTIAKGNSKIEIPKLSLDIGDNYVIKIVLLHNADSIPEFHREGKIVGQKDIIINPIQKPAPTFWSMTFEGIWWVQLIRLVSYSLLGFAILLAIVSLSDKINEIHQKKNRKKEIEQRKEEIKQREQEISKLNIIPSVKDEYLKFLNTRDTDYADNSFWLIPVISDLYRMYSFDNEANITKRFLKMHTYLQREVSNMDSEEYNRVKEKYDAYSYYIKNGFLILNKSNNSITFNTNAKESIFNLQTYLSVKENETNTSKPLRTIDEIISTIV